MISIYTVDSFTREIFKGNPAAVCTSFRDVPSSTDLDIFFQQIATEMNISETAFITKANDSSSNSRYFLQWFTPTNEVDLCGHATLATAHVLFEEFLQNSSIDKLIFETKKVGELKVKKCDNQGRLQLDFPMGDPQSIDLDNQILNEIKSKLNITQDIITIQLCKRTKKLLIHLSSIDDNIKPQQNLTEIKFDQSIQPFIRGIILTSKSTIPTTTDFISRYFAPWNGILEDPVTGSAHTVLAVYWSRILNKSILNGYQKSARGGHVECELDAKNQRVLLRGKSTIPTTTDFISRYFAPWNGILEDPVTGSAHTVLAVYWSRILNKSILNGYQKSARGGHVECELDAKNQRVLLRGHAVTVMQGQLQIARDSLLKNKN
ncbi:unnamed protein product [Adineta steineri]|uniref:Phenazine biosynthesis-like domain-containing protein n=1 Tax=Adineta steineri TaxID=433720 RepID=A0A815I000_9BILA|nr:unnamed protein product [Adineta steineri]